MHMWMLAYAKLKKNNFSKIMCRKSLDFDGCVFDIIYGVRCNSFSFANIWQKITNRKCMYRGGIVDVVVLLVVVHSWPDAATCMLEMTFFPLKILLEFLQCPIVLSQILSCFGRTGERFSVCLLFRDSDPNLDHKCPVLRIGSQN